VRFAAIAGWADSDTYPVSFMCAWLGVSRSGYYAWRGAEPSRRSRDEDDHLGPDGRDGADVGSGGLSADPGSAAPTLTGCWSTMPGWE
jgi:hypothetical protein